MQGSKRLLIVDDESAIVHMLDDYFRMEGYETVCALNAGAALQAVEAALAGGRGIDLALLDVNMPGMDGFELCRRVRESLECPIIFLTARIEDADQLDGFAAGADDYVLKPFSLQVLGSRVKAHLAREDRRDSSRDAGVLRFGDVAIDYAARVATVNTSSGVVALDLTRTEFDIIALLSKHAGRVYDRSQIYEEVWGWDATGDPSIVREHVRRIRKKCQDAGGPVDLIETVWGVGYRWAARS
ncbi:response regulator transcription factor [Enorma phocaeensis]|uniref:Response regulator transcription factor n=2 Tax=Enorma phocaeensis TaxID=1871019 RepID=A0ABT7V973_9ACTN|nr:response regulator transcription factor [Enorma phocaeensis]MBM6953222.1 response regulator transcription factor [Enorma phocaeensis]MDM8275051.1 response regulator transcription factor [Enorma phocaeensis]